MRIAPDQVVMEDPTALKTIYGLNSGFTKVMKSKSELVATATRAGAAAATAAAALT